ncbi:hypothetical protein KY284_037648 [Solanum tuberosum]|nr:hypothetical protein KY284_037648 [Solanum tuberosum]
MISGEQLGEVGLDMGGNLKRVRDSVTSVPYKAINPIFPPSIDSGCVEELSIGIPLTERINSGLGSPKILFLLEQGLIFFLELCLKVPKEVVVRVSTGLLDSLQSSHNFPDFLEDVTKGVFVPFHVLSLEHLNGIGEVRGGVKAILDRISKGWMPTPHGLNSERLDVHKVLSVVKSDLKWAVVRLGPRKVGHSGIGVSNNPKVVQTLLEHTSSKVINTPASQLLTTSKNFIGVTSNEPVAIGVIRELDEFFPQIISKRKFIASIDCRKEPGVSISCYLDHDVNALRNYGDITEF